MKMENIRLDQELQLANKQLERINIELEHRVEYKTHVLQVSQEMFEVLPVAAIGIDSDGMIVCANQLAHLILSKDENTPSFLGEASNTILPNDLLTWASSGLHQRNEDAKYFIVAGHSIRCWSRSLGEFSKSKGFLIVMDANLHPNHVSK
jgi:hypothetical protein